MLGVESLWLEWPWLELLLVDLRELLPLELCLVEELPWREKLVLEEEGGGFISSMTDMKERI